MKGRVTASLMEHVSAIAESCGASAIFVYADALVNQVLPLPEGLDRKVFYITRTACEESTQEERGARYVRVPDVRFTRMGQVKIAVFLALARGLIQRGDIIVCLSGVAKSGGLDTLVVMEIGEEFEMFAMGASEDTVPSEVRADVVERVLSLASELGQEGREGKPVGALFVIGDSDRVQSMTKPLILNPFRGYPEHERNILDPMLEETVKELASIDGAYIIRADGLIESCGAYIKVASQHEFELPRGLGARHHTAAAITAITNSIAITVSESTGTVTVFAGGQIITEIEKPRSQAYAEELNPPPWNRAKALTGKCARSQRD